MVYITSLPDLVPLGKYPRTPSGNYFLLLHQGTISLYSIRELFPCTPPGNYFFVLHQGTIFPYPLLNVNMAWWACCMLKKTFDRDYSFNKHLATMIDYFWLADLDYFLIMWQIYFLIQSLLWACQPWLWFSWFSPCLKLLTKTCLGFYFISTVLIVIWLVVE